MIPLLVSCTTGKAVVRTPEELEFARDAVVHMMAIIVPASSQNLFPDDGTNGSVAELTPSDATAIIESVDTVPGLRLLLDRYLEQMSEALRTILRDLPAALERQYPAVRPADPYAIIEGNSDAVTRYFARELGPWVETWIAEQLRGPAGGEALGTWRDLIRIHTIYAQSRNKLAERTGEPMMPIVDADPVRTVTITVLRNLLVRMETQEELVRAMAAAYDDPRLALFVSD